MHRNFKLYLALLVAAWIVVPFLAHAADEVYTCDVKRAITGKLDSYGQPYMTVICNESRTLAGNSYIAGVPVTFFGYTGDAPTEGAKVKMIVTKGLYQGKASYTGHQLLTE